MPIRGNPRCGRQPHTDDVAAVKKFEDFYHIRPKGNHPHDLE